jgi:hypothetical protein
MKSRRYSLFILLALALCFVFAYGLAPLMKTGAAAPAQAENAPFKGKIAMVMLNDNHSLHLERAQVRKLGERSFLVGKGSDMDIPFDYTKNRMVWIPMNHIKMIVEFEKVEEAKEAWEEIRKNWEELRMNALPPQAKSPDPSIDAAPEQIKR